MPEPRRPHVAVLGGGITGLAAAWYLRDKADVTVLEGSDRLGGKIRTERFAGLDVDVGPDSFLARIPYAADLCRDIGLGDDLVTPATGKAYIWTRGKLRPIPEATVLGVPSRLRPLAKSGVVSRRGVARAALDAVLPRPRSCSDDRSITDVVGARFGREVVDRLVDPLLGGIHAGRSDRLSLDTNAPDVAHAARSRSLMKGLREHLAGAPSSGPVFLTIRQGLGALVDRLEKELRAQGVDIWREHPVTWLERKEDGRYRVGPSIVADAVIVAVPAPAAARVLERGRADVAAVLRGVNHSSVVTVTLAYPKMRMPLDGSGFLVPRVDGRLLTACTWLSAKWSHLDAGRYTVLRASAGRYGDERSLHVDDGALVDHLHSELADAMGLTARPVDARVDRWHDGFPQYEPGHGERIMQIEGALHDIPGVAIAGAAYRGVGITSCIQQGAQAAAEVGKLLS